MRRVRFWIVLATWLAACAPVPEPLVSAARPIEAGRSRPLNVLLILVDTLRADHLGCYGYARDTSPYLDEFAEGSVLFRNCMTQWPKTGPAMAAFFSSVYGSRSGVARNTGQWVVPDSYELTAETFQKAGYQTLAMVSNGSLTADLGYDQGFDVYREARSIPGKAAADVSREVVEWLERRDRDRPYFVWAHYIDPHTPYAPPKDQAERFVGDDLWHADTRPSVPVMPEEGRLEGKRPGSGAIGAIQRHCYLEGLTEPRDYVARYDAEIRSFDDALRSMMARLRTGGHLDDTVVIFTADHGESLGDHEYYFEHGRYPFDACTHVPLIIQHPQWPPRVVETPIAHIDIMPTILESLGMAPPHQAQGKSLLTFLQDGSFPENPEPVFTESGYGEEFSIAMRVGRWKLIATPDRKLIRELGASIHLFDVTADPGETRNLVDQEPDVMRMLWPLLQRFQREAYLRDAAPDNHRQTRKPDAETESMLRAMGYLQSEPDDAPPEGDTADHSR